MARNKYPEETVNRILEESLDLFLEKGYEHTTIRDIIDNLGGLSKGAIYHHFKSKEDILEAVTERMFSEVVVRMARIRDDERLSGKEKFTAMFRASVNNPSQRKLIETAPDIMKNPQLLAAQLRQICKSTVPDFIEPIIRQGMADGSIPTQYPRELAETLMLLFDLWLNPLVFHVAKEEQLLRKFHFINEMLHGMGLDLLDEIEEEFINRLRGYHCSLSMKK